MKGHRMMCKHIAEKCFSSWQNKSLLKRRSSSSLSHQHFLLFPLSFIRFTFIHFCHTFSSARREEWQRRREICEKIKGAKPRPHNSSSSSHHPCSFYPHLSLFFCFRSPSWTYALVLLCVYPVFFSAQGYDALKALCLMAQMLVF